MPMTPYQRQYQSTRTRHFRVRIAPALAIVEAARSLDMSAARFIEVATTRYIRSLRIAETRRAK